MTPVVLVCEHHPDSRWVIRQGLACCLACDSARKLVWSRKRRAAGLLPEQSDTARAARREIYAWRQAHLAYHALCDRLGIF